ncbi:MAG: aminotransferase [Deltaproteobacteria bacterium]|nr:MAG: aminotransferase [Deltaproteobacteria bacterium]
MNEMWHYSRRAIMMKSSVIRETLKITQKPGIISFGGGLPAPELFPKEELAEAAQKVIREQGEKALQYSTTEGYPPLREFIAQRMEKFGIKVSPDEIMITAGSQQGLDMCGRVFLDWGDSVVTARPTYLGAIQAFNAYFPKYVTLPSDDDGMTVDGLKEILETHNPRMIYLVPTFQNPDGRTIPIHRRERIIELARTYGVPIIEDDPYSELTYEGTIPTPMKALAPDDVIMLGTFSKLLAPGLRIGWLIAPPGVIDKFVRMKQGADLHTNTLAQFIIYEFVKDGKLDEHLTKIRELYAKRLKVMIEAMEHYFPPEVKFTRPKGGMFLWVELPEKVNTTELLPKAVEKNVAYIPGSAFYPDGGGHNTMRLNYSKPTEAEIEEGIKRLAEVFKEALAS